jgi:Ser/Thr protein kinase RdoA (MazF antagonist)
VTDPRLSPDDADEVAELYGVRAAGPLTVAARGELGRIWHLPTSADGLAVKDLFFPPSEQEAARDVAFQLRALDAGLVLPRPVPRPDGQVLGRLRSGVTVRAYEWVELRPLGPRPVAEVGRLLARLHRLAPTSQSPPEPWFTDPVGGDAWGSLADAAGRAGAPFADGLAALTPELVTLEKELLPASHHHDLRHCHRDLDDSNLAWDRDGRLVLLDWENSGPASPTQELATLAADYGDAAEELVRAYDGPGAVGSAADFAMAVAVQGHLVEFYVGRWLRTADAEDRQRSEWRMRQILASPLTRDRIATLVDALAD